MIIFISLLIIIKREMKIIIFFSGKPLISFSAEPRNKSLPMRFSSLMSSILAFSLGCRANEATNRLLLLFIATNPTGDE
jgi:hypothetical protein